jgi:hypothetical protein
MSELLSSITGGGDGFAVRLASSGFIAAGVTGTILTITPPAGQKVRLTALSQEAAYEQAGISIFFDAEEVISEARLRSAAPEGTNGATKDFSVGPYFDWAGTLPPVSNFQHLTGRQDEVLTIVKNAGNTIQNIYYGYQLGE